MGGIDTQNDEKKNGPPPMAPMSCRRKTRRQERRRGFRGSPQDRVYKTCTIDPVALVLLAYI
jgi:hypothetical protein